MHPVSYARVHEWAREQTAGVMDSAKHLAVSMVDTEHPRPHHEAVNHVEHVERVEHVEHAGRVGHTGSGGGGGGASSAAQTQQPPMDRRGIAHAPRVTQQQQQHEQREGEITRALRRLNWPRQHNVHTADVSASPSRGTRDHQAPGTAVKDDSLHWDYVAFANDAYLG